MWGCFLYETKRFFKGSSDSSVKYSPLASRMAPKTLEEYMGQAGIIGDGKLLRRAIEADSLGSVIFYGPSGSGKTLWQAL
jgi:putative ATPase